MNIRNSTEGRNLDKQNTSTNEWVPRDDLLYHRGLLQKGFMVVKPFNEAEDEVHVPFVTENSFTIKDRKLYFAADIPDNKELSERFEKNNPKQAANLLARIPALNPYKEWQIYFADDISKVDPQKITKKTIVLTPTFLKTKAKKEKSQSGAESVEISIKKGFVTAYFIKQGRWLKQENVLLTDQINLLTFTSEERKLIEATQKEIMISSKQERDDSSRELKNGLSIHIAQKILSKNNISPFDVFLHNAERRDEFFVPLDEIGLYVCPWTGKQDSDVKTSHVNNFVTAVCMFGPSLKAIDDESNEFILIKHNKVFFNGQKVIGIQYNTKAANPYETMLFSEFEKQVSIIKSMADSKKQPTLLCHLPYIDYMLFGIELFIRGRITLNALGQLFKCILKKKEEYVRKITSICEKYNVNVRLESPFENLFHSLSSMNVLNHKNDEAAKIILSELNVPSVEVNPTLINENQRKKNEQLLVQSILERLVKNNYLHNHQHVWEDYLEVITMQQQKDFHAALNGILAQLKKTTPNIIQRQYWDKYLKQINDKLCANDTFDLQEILENLKSCALELEDKKAGREEYKIWVGLLKTLNKNKIWNLEQLFKVANAYMIALASFKTGPFETCSMLPLSEKRIPMEYTIFEQISGQIEKEMFEEALKRDYEVTANRANATTSKITCVLRASSKARTPLPEFTPTYPPTINMTFLDPLVAYGLKPKSKVSSGYQECDLQSKNHNNTDDYVPHNESASNSFLRIEGSMNPNIPLSLNKDMRSVGSPNMELDERKDKQSTRFGKGKSEVACRVDDVMYDDEEEKKTDDCSNQGPAFYFSQCQETLNSFLKVGLNSIYKNVGIFDQIVKGALPKHIEKENESELRRILDF